MSRPRRREHIRHGTGLYIARRAPEAELVHGDTQAVVVKFTHDLERAADTAWSLWHSTWPEYRLGRPCRDWWRKCNWDLRGEGWGYTWLPAVPGRAGSIPVVVFDFDPADRTDCLTTRFLAGS